MVALNHTVTDVADSTYETIAPGTYDGEIVAIDQKTSRAGNEYLSVQVRIEGKGSVWDNLNYFAAAGSTTKQIADEKLSAIGAAVGVQHIADTDTLLARRVRIVVAHEPDRADPNKVWPRIMRYTAPAAAEAAPAPAAPAPAPAAPAAAPASAPPPWRAA